MIYVDDAIRCDRTHWATRDVTRCNDNGCSHACYSCAIYEAEAFREVKPCDFLASRYNVITGSTAKARVPSETLICPFTFPAKQNPIYIYIYIYIYVYTHIYRSTPHRASLSPENIAAAAAFRHRPHVPERHQPPLRLQDIKQNHVLWFDLR